ncbi:transposase [Sporosarcina trichiuri]|uniref:transposase n=1 Tax=Sporosarcina trichiuri TaxID=3056445 RepID=UPI0025B59B18|nr:transposase [Sporosarcina sp. 0.2-SM1T-5]WJY26595.1 transposase [Sporosarcina sp. 0.2-SM1T-5]
MGKHQTHEFKVYICRLVVEEGRKMTELSYETGVALSTIRKWVAKYRQASKEIRLEEGMATPKDIEKRLRQAEKEVEDLKQENEILKKAMHVFAKSQS